MEPIARCDCFRRLLLQHRHDPVHQGQLLLLPLSLRQRRQGDLTELPQVAGQSLGGLGGVKRLQLVEGGQLGGEGLVLGLAEGVVVEAGGEVLRGHGLATRRRDCPIGSKGAPVNASLLYTHRLNWDDSGSAVQRVFSSCMNRWFTDPITRTIVGKNALRP